MNYEELSFVNQQLAGMLKSGIPLEGALQQLSANMRHGRYRVELEALRSDLEKGVPLPEALAARKLPEFYIRMLQLGARTNDLPGVLTVVADYYQRANGLWTRLKGLMVYPFMVIAVSLALSIFVALILQNVLRGIGGDDNLWDAPAFEHARSLIRFIWLPSIVLFLIGAALTVAFTLPAARRYLRWRLPGFHENSLTNFASTMALMLRSGSHFGEALDVAQSLELGSPAGKELTLWKRKLADGQLAFAETAAESRSFPALFLWLIAQGGEDLATGFQRAADVYYTRAVSRADLLLYAALPVSVLVLGIFILGQFAPLFRTMTFTLDSLGLTGN
jgi:type II secretory pathway component PulF